MKIILPGIGMQSNNCKRTHTNPPDKHPSNSLNVPQNILPPYVSDSKKAINWRLLFFPFAPPSLPTSEDLRNDPLMKNENVLYTMDTTVQKEFHGLGMGQFLKHAQVLLASQEGVKLICGKNREQMARAMIKLNLSIGSYEREYIQDNYNDENQHRNSFYYHCPVQWEPPPLNLSRRISSPCEDIDENFIEEQLPCLANKVCLSNFVSERFLKLLREVSAPLPASLQHIYSASGQSECADKVGKSLWYSHKKSNRMINVPESLFW